MSKLRSKTYEAIATIDEMIISVEKSLILKAIKDETRVPIAKLKKKNVPGVSISSINKIKDKLIKSINILFKVFTS